MKKLIAVLVALAITGVVSATSIENTQVFEVSVVGYVDNLIAPDTVEDIDFVRSEFFDLNPAPANVELGTQTASKTGSAGNLLVEVANNSRRVDVSIEASVQNVVTSFILTAKEDDTVVKATDYLFSTTPDVILIPNSSFAATGSAKSFAILFDITVNRINQTVDLTVTYSLVDTDAQYPE